MRKPSRAFNKRFYTVAGFLVATREIYDHLDDILAARRWGRISRAFAEKIMLAVTKGRPAQNSSLARELGVLFLGVTLVPLGAVAWGANRLLSRLVIRREAFEN